MEKIPGFFVHNGTYEVLPFSEHNLLLIKKWRYRLMCPKIFQEAKLEIEKKLNTHIERYLEGGIFFANEKRFIAYCVHPQSP